MRQISINSFTLLRVRVLERRKGSAQGYMYNRQLLLPLKVTNWRAGKGPNARHIWAKKKKTKREAGGKISPAIEKGGREQRRRRPKTKTPSSSSSSEVSSNLISSKRGAWRWCCQMVTFIPNSIASLPPFVFNVAQENPKGSNGNIYTLWPLGRFLLHQRNSKYCLNAVQFSFLIQLKRVSPDFAYS